MPPNASRFTPNGGDDLGPVVKRATYWLPVGLYAGLIFFFSSLSHPEEILPITVWDKFAHVVEYAILGILSYRAFFNAGSDWTARHALLLGIMLSAAYGLTDEFHQMFIPQRQADLLDFFADSIGASVGATTFHWLIRT
jgi:VanZ family protein